MKIKLGPFEFEVRMKYLSRMRPAGLFRRMTSRPRRAALLLIAALALIPPPAKNLESEEMILTTWYPSPLGIYRQLTTTGGSIANPVNTILNRNAGNVGIGTTNPQAKLDVAGDGSAILIPRKTTAGDPAGSNGMIYYNGNSNKFRIFQNGAWQDMIATGGQVWGGIKYVPDGSQISSSCSTDICHARALNSKIQLRITNGTYNYDTGWVDATIVSGGYGSTVRPTVTGIQCSTLLNLEDTCVSSADW